MKTKEIIFAFVPILLLFLYFYYTEAFVLFSQEILGKLLATFLIVFYSSLHPLYGFLACILVIFYFQIVSSGSLYRENMDTNCLDRNLGETIYFSEDWRSKSLVVPSFDNAYVDKRKAIPTTMLDTTSVWNESCLTGQPAHFTMEKPSVILTDSDDLDKIISNRGGYKEGV
jgi:hypothetical protein